jgi:thiamine-phosphate pyrophosphorylase
LLFLAFCLYSSLSLSLLFLTDFLTGFFALGSAAALAALGAFATFGGFGALGLGAQAVHLGGGPVDASSVHTVVAAGLRVSAAAHSDDEVRAALAAGISALVLSPIFDVPGKGQARGTDALRRARALSPDAVLFALGGVTVANGNDCYDAGAHGVAVQRALFGAKDPASVARGLLPPA